MKMDKNTWRIILIAAAVGIVADYWWTEEQVFFLFYEPHIDPSMPVWGTRLEALLWTPLYMFLDLWWMTVPLLSILILAAIKMRRAETTGR
jgi:hypothetical protein